MTVLIGMFLLGVSIALGTWVLSWSDHVKRELVVRVFFCTESTCAQPVTAKQINTVRVQLESDPRVKSVKFVPKDEALKIMQRRAPLLVTGVSSNPLPDAEEVTPKRPEDVRAIAASVSGLNKPPGVEKVSYGARTANRILRVGKIISSIFVGIVVLLLAASTLLIANTIRLSIYARRREIEVMKLVGASNWFVRGPFMLEGLFCGLAGSLLAILLLLLGKELALPQILPRVDTDSDVEALAFAWTALILMLIGLLVGAAGSGLTLRRFLKV